jgi:NodT family efflux transporter outer membrane factor (OMF) lipoprotein
MGRSFRAVGWSAPLALFVAGCVNLGPDYVRPEAPIQPTWIESKDARVSSEPPVEPRWWHAAFHDPVLDRLVEKALQGNLSLRSAGLRVLQSQQQLAIAIGFQFPQQQQATGSASRQRTPAGSGSVVFNQYAVGFNLGWEIDFWGRFRRQVQSASASLDASVASYDGALLSIVSQVAQNYVLVRTLQERIDVARENVLLVEESRRITTAKFKAGEVSELDVSQAETLVNNTRATVSSLETSLQQTKNALAVLLGLPPAEMTGLVAEKAAILTPSPEIALGMPQDLLRRRPDIRVAERQLAAQSAQIGVAETDLYPALSIGGSIGRGGSSGRDIFHGDTTTWSLFGDFQWNLFSYGRLESNVRLQDARFQQLLVDYRETVLQAQGDIENAIVAYLKSHEQLAAYRLAEGAAQRAVDLSTTQYENGLVDFNTVISTLQSLVAQRDLLSATQGSVATNLVQVYRALGGGWEIRDNRDPVDFLPAAMKEEMRQRTRQWRGVLCDSPVDGSTPGDNADQCGAK